jgi:hypothetical protein
VLVVGRKDRRAVGAERLDRRTVLARHRVDAGHELEMLALRVVDQGHRRSGDRRQPRDLAGMVHAELDHCGAVRRPQPQQGQRQADVVVEVAFGGEAGVALPGTEDRGDHLRHRGLAVAAGHRHQRQDEAPAPGRGELAESEARVRHLEAGQPGFGEAALGERGHRAGRLRPRQEIVGVEAVAAQGHEQVAGTQAPGIAVHPGEGERQIAEPLRGRQARGRVAERRHRHRRCAGATPAAAVDATAPALPAPPAPDPPAPLRHALRRGTDA